ncbi:MAG: antibiotic biosynthesis monooxygenase [Muribaculaceae bacterium]|nr:antibiotic biosynthesis monooxygenase [Muribaculaceae bacterium]
MIRLNVFLLLEDVQKKAAARFVGTELVEKSLKDKGCIAYDLFESTTVDNHMMICETWASEEDLKAHMATEHFRTLVPKLEEIATLTMEKFNF